MRDEEGCAACAAPAQITTHLYIMVRCDDEYIIITIVRITSQYRHQQQRQHRHSLVRPATTRAGPRRRAHTLTPRARAHIPTPAFSRLRIARTRARAHVRTRARTNAKHTRPHARLRARTHTRTHRAQGGEAAGQGGGDGASRGPAPAGDL